jgi:Zn-dependent protease with chaperone function
MFNNIIYFIVVLFIFNVADERVKPENSAAYTVAVIFFSWVIFSLYSRWAFQRSANRLRRGGEGEAGLAREYHALMFRFSVIAIGFFALMVFFFHLKYWLHAIPGFELFSVLQGVVALMIFLMYFILLWYHSHPVYRLAFGSDIKRKPFIVSNIRLNIPILFPWVIVSLAYDLLSLIPWSDPEGLLSQPESQMIFFAFFLILLMIFMPGLVRYWWGCKPLHSSEKAEVLAKFLEERGFRHAGLLNWPVFEGRMMTAGIMGIVPRYRYFLVTEALMEILSIEELKAVLAHEMGHAKHRHLFFYILFFFGFMVISFGLLDILQYFLLTQSFLMKLLQKSGPESSTLFYVFLSLPFLLIMIVYFRYIMGFFMRHFERQADLYSAEAMGTPRHIISSLEKIAVLSGKIRGLPSWHHFSIKERVDLLWRTTQDTGLRKKHNRMVAVSLGVYLVLVVCSGYLTNFSTYKESLTHRLLERALLEQTNKEPNNVLLYQNLAMVYHKTGDLRGAIQAYQKILILDPHQAIALNNLAWILATSSDKSLRNPEKALILARRAVALDRSPMFLDTLAEALYANGLASEAIGTIKEAISMAPEARAYYESQLRKFQQSLSP